MGIASDSNTYVYTKTCDVCGRILGNNDHGDLKAMMTKHKMACHDMIPEGEAKPSVSAIIEDEKREKPSVVDTVAKTPTVVLEEAKPSVVGVIPETLTVDASPSSKPTPNIATALCTMQAHDLCATTDSANPFFKSKYADLSSVWGVIRKPLTDAGLSIMQYVEQADGEITVITRLYHVSGEMVETRLSGNIVPDKNGKSTIQGLGSLITYLRRYSISMICGVSPVDDDGNAASAP